MMKYLNERGISLYITASGIVPSWMTSDGKILSEYKYFAEMMRSFVSWTKYKEDIKFSLFDPLIDLRLAYISDAVPEPTCGVHKACRILLDHSRVFLQAL